MAKKESKISPLGEAKWAHVHEPKTGFDGGDDGKFQVDLVFEKGGEWDNICRDVNEKYKANEKLKHNPVKPEKDQNGEKTGRGYITFKTGAQYPPKVFDKFGHVITSDIMVGNGSTVRVNYTMDQYNHRGNEGVTFYFNAIMVDDLVEYKGGSAEDFGFPVEDGDNPFLEMKDDEPQTENDPSEPADDAEIPF